MRDFPSQPRAAARGRFVVGAYAVLAGVQVMFELREGGLVRDDAPRAKPKARSSPPPLPDGHRPPNTD